MKTWHHALIWVALIAVGYFAGVFYPSVGQAARAKAGI